MHSLFIPIFIFIFSTTNALFTNRSTTPNLCGIYALGNLQDQDLQRMRDYPWVTGFAMRIKWRDIETSNNYYNWSRLDRTFAAVEERGLKLTILLTPPEPNYIAQTPNVLTWFDAPWNTTRPVYWDNFTLTRRDALFRAMAEHQIYSSVLGRTIAMADHPNLANLNFGFLGNGIRDPAGLGAPKLKDLPGYNRSACLDSLLRQMRSEVFYFPNQAHMIGFWSVEDNNTVNPLWRDIQDALLNEFNGVDKPKISFWHEDLGASRDVNSTSSPIVGRPTIEYAHVLYESKNRTPISFQMLQPWVAPFNPVKTQYTLPSDAIVYALDTYNAHYHEVYLEDLDKAENEPLWDPLLRDLTLTQCIPANGTNGTGTGGTSTSTNSGTGTGTVSNTGTGTSNNSGTGTGTEGTGTGTNTGTSTSINTGNGTSTSTETGTVSTRSNNGSESVIVFSTILLIAIFF